MFECRVGLKTAMAESQGHGDRAKNLSPEWWPANLRNSISIKCTLKIIFIFPSMPITCFFYHNPFQKMFIKVPIKCCFFFLNGNTPPLQRRFVIFFSERDSQNKPVWSDRPWGVKNHQAANSCWCVFSLWLSKSSFFYFKVSIYSAVEINSCFWKSLQKIKWHLIFFWEK